MAVPVPLCKFSSLAKGIRFYDVSMAEVQPGLLFKCQLEATNIYGSNCIALMSDSLGKLGHLARDDASVLAPLLQEGYKARG